MNFRQKKLTKCIKSNSTLSRALRKLKDIKARLLFDLSEISITSQIIENVCNIVLVLISGDWFSLIIVSVLCI